MKYVKYLLLSFTILIITGCGQDNLKSLSYKELITKLDNKDTFFFEVVQDGCSHCKNFTPILKEVLNEYDVVGYQLNVSNLSDEDIDEFDKLFNVTATPTTIFIKDGVEVSLMQRINGSTTKDYLISKLKANGYIK